MLDKFGGAVELAQLGGVWGGNPTGSGYETGNRASIRTCSGLGVVGFRVHDLIQCFHFVQGKKDEMLLSCSRT
jgi:hypothetical protein